MNITFCRSANTGVSMRMSPQNNVTYESVSISSAVPNMSFWSYFNNLCDGSSAAVELLFCGMLLSGCVQNNMQHSCVVLSSLLS